MKYLVLLLSLLQAEAFGAEVTANLLKQIRVERVDQKTEVHFELSQPADMGNMEVRFLKRTIEWDMPTVSLKKDKMFIDVGAADINNIYVANNDSKGIRIRVNFDNDKMASNYHERMKYSKAKNQLVLTFDAAVPLVSHNMKELSRTYDVMNESAMALEEHIASRSVIKLDGAKDADASGIDNGVTASADDESSMAIDESKSENEIPIAVKANKNKEASSSSILRLILGMAAAGLMLLSVVIVGKKLNKKRMGAPFNHDSIKLVSQKYLGPKRNLTLVRVSGEYLLLGVTDHNISLIKTLTVVDDEIPDLVPQDFKSTVKKASQRVDELDEQVSEVEDSFSVSSLNDVRKIFKNRKYIDETDV